ncbi:uncharacterized protein TNCV_5033831 [Trichonephila clavipes]|nr:uncharacterized protein TNCV_5033831 [Trichonephila clavipes]
MALLCRIATSGAMSQEWGSFVGQQVSSRTVQRRLQQHGLSARRSWLRLPLQLHQDRSHQDGRIHVWRYRGEHTLTACIRHRHTSPSPDVMVWGTIGYTSRLPLVHTDGTLNSACYISGVLRPVAQPFIRALRNPTFQ